MSDVVQLAKVAREQLAAALNALQNGVNVPEELMEVADPIAEAMSVFHRIERSGGTQLEGRAEALAHVRGALDRLQAIEAIHPAIDAVMEAVAASLSKAHTLSRYQPPAAAPKPAPAPAPAPAPVFAPAPAPAPVFAPIPSAPSATPIPRPPAGPAPTPAVQPQAVIPLGVPHAAPQPVPVAAVAPQPVAPAPQLIPVPDPAPSFSAFAPVGVSPTGVPRSSSDPGPSFASGPAFSPSPAQAPADAYPSAAAAYTPPVAYTPPQAYPAPAPSAPEPHRAPGGVAGQPAGPTIVVELGTRSTSNFFKGLAGNDVVEHGGLFVATYKIPKIGSSVTLHVLMPGNYEFHATALVQWVREPRSDNTEPGFGARLTEIGAEGRQLVYRYTRNREPLFYDDL